MKLNPAQILQSLFTPLEKAAAIAEQGAKLTTEIHQVVTVDLKKASENSYKELEKHTILLGEIKDLLKEQIRQREDGGSNSGMSSKIKMPGIMGGIGIGFAIITMAAALVVAAGLFSRIPTVTPAQLLTALAVGALFVLLTPIFVEISESLRGGGLVNRIIGKMAGVGGGTIKDMLKDTGGTALAMIAMAIGVTAASAIFQFVQPITGVQFLTALAIGVIFIPLSFAFGRIIIAMRRARVGMDARGFKTLGMATLSMAVMALGIAAVARIWNETMPDQFVKLPDFEWIFKAGLVIWFFSAGFSKILRAVKGASIKDMIFATAALPLLAIALVGVAYIFQSFDQVNDWIAPPIEWTLKSALAMLVFSLSFSLLVRAIKRSSIKDIAFAALAIPMLAVAIVGTAWIFSWLGEDYKAPDTEWSTKAALSILLFSVSFALLSIVFSKFKIGLKEIMLGIIGSIGVAVAILAVSHIFSYLPGNFTTPAADWAIDAAKAIGVFAVVVGVIGGILAATGGAGALALLAGVVGVILIAGGIWAVAWIFSKIPTDFATGMETLSAGLMAPLNGMVNVLARVKNEIGIENLPALAGGLVLIAGAWLTLVGALAGQAVGGFVSSVANLGTALVDGIASFFGGEGTKSPFDLLNLLLDKATAVKTVSRSLYNVGESYVKIAANTNAVINGLGAWGKFMDEDGADSLERSADASERLAIAYGKFATASNKLNIKNVQASTQLFRAIADLGKKDALSGMKKLTDELLKAVEELSKTVVNLETAVEKQADNQEGLLEQAGNVIGGAVDAAKNLIKGASTTVDKNTPKTPEQKKEAEKEKAAMDARQQQELLDALTTMNLQLSKLVSKFSDSSGTTAPYVRIAT